MFTKTRFLIIRLSSIGDVLHSTPVAQALKIAFPDCHITWLVGQVPSSLLTSNPYIDELYIWPRERWETHMRRGQFKSAWKLWQKLQTDLESKHFDVVLDIHGLFLSGMIAAASKAPRRIGMDHTRELNWLFMNEIAPSSPQEVHVIQRYLSVLKPLGIHSKEYAMTLQLPEEAITFATDFLRDHGISKQDTIIAFNPGTTWPSKNWPTEYYAAVINSFKNNEPILLCGGPGEQKLGESIIQQLNRPIINAINQTSLLQLAALISQCSVLVTGDTGPLHMGIGLGIPTVSLFGPTDPQKFGPLTGKHIILEESMNCRPCHKKSCPLTHLNCMHSLSPERVIRAIQTVVHFQRLCNNKSKSYEVNGMNTPTAKITHLFHSGYAVETANHFLIFDYYQPVPGKNLSITEGIITSDYLKDKKNILVFVSHNHADHFDPAVIEWAKDNPEITYILSSDVEINTSQLNCHIVSAYEEVTAGQVRIKTFGSTDQGISFFVQLDGLSIFHAGDLNWWDWTGESLADRKAAEVNFKAEIAKIAEKITTIDIAFFPVDRRMEESYSKGADYFADQFKPKLLVPMHFGKDFDATTAFADKAKSLSIHTVEIHHKGQEIFFS
ncbi:lipopolysaccharide heptosyltransferase II [Pelosinus sp. sgz500959]|uniref:lipopolysaccharide heptosyltransferase II n=1 Tax=Pelosinus sp. sgz500959 TaxID=3242472 RepID=UPI0036703DE1